MKDLMKLVNETESDLKALGIKTGCVTKWEINTRAKKRWGQCKRTGYNSFEINISSALLDDSTDNQSVKNVIAHELLHTVNGCFAHKGKWKESALLVNSKLPCYNIKTADKFDSIELPESQLKAKYIIMCTACGFKAERYRASNVIKYPYRYRCPLCKGKLTVREVKGE